MKSVNYSFNSSVRANFVLLWRLKMEEGGRSGCTTRGSPRPRRALWKADKALHTAFSPMINCLFIWRCPGRSEADN